MLVVLQITHTGASKSQRASSQQYWFLEAKLPEGYIKIDVTIIQQCLQKLILVQVIIVNSASVSKYLARATGKSGTRSKGVTTSTKGASRSEQRKLFILKQGSKYCTRKGATTSSAGVSRSDQSKLYFIIECKQFPDTSRRVQSRLCMF